MKNYTNLNIKINPNAELKFLDLDDNYGYFAIDLFEKGKDIELKIEVSKLRIE